MVSPVKEIKLRGEDPTGHGYYGAKRGTKKHKGLDIVTNPKEVILAPIHGFVTKIGYPYSFALQFRYVEITNDVYRVRLMYVSPKPSLKKGQRVFAGDVIGNAQDIASYWDENMLNHIHFEVYKHGLLTDPEPLLI